MRDLVVHAWTSVDGFNLDEGTEAMKWAAEIDDPVGDELFAARLAGAGTHIMGRVTYLEMADFWPQSSDVNAAPMNDVPKVVFSRTLREAPWPETTIAAGDTEAEIARLKAEPGGEIVAHGGTAFARSLIQLGLVDEYRFWLLPAAAGTGVALFTDFTRLRLRSSTAFPSGVLELAYAPAGNGR